MRGPRPNSDRHGTENLSPCHSRSQVKLKFVHLKSVVLKGRQRNLQKKAR